MSHFERCSNRLKLDLSDFEKCLNRLPTWPAFSFGQHVRWIGANYGQIWLSRDYKSDFEQCLNRLPTWHNFDFGQLFMWIGSNNDQIRLAGWTEGTEVEFMIDTGCQVTILATSVFEWMCASDSRVWSRLCPCGQRLISADSSPSMVWGELDMTVAFLGLECDMVLVVASIGSEGLLGTEVLQSCLPHQLDLRTGQLWADGQSTLQLHQQPARALWLCLRIVKL